MWDAHKNVRDKVAEKWWYGENLGLLFPRTVSFAVFAYLAGLKLGQTLPAMCCGCDISLELPMAAVSLPGCYEMPGGATDPNLTLGNHDVVKSGEACALGTQWEWRGDRSWRYGQDWPGRTVVYMYPQGRSFALQQSSQLWLGWVSHFPDGEAAKGFPMDTNRVGARPRLSNQSSTGLWNEPAFKGKHNPSLLTLHQYISPDKWTYNKSGSILTRWDFYFLFKTTEEINEKGGHPLACLWENLKHTPHNSCVL